jgi:hypothetical protein
MAIRGLCVVALLALALPTVPGQIQKASEVPAVAIPGDNADACKCPQGMSVTCKDSSPVARTFSYDQDCYCRNEGGLDQVCLQPETDSCSCTKEMEPQCNWQGLLVASNACIAKCFELRPADVNLWNCGLFPVRGLFSLAESISFIFRL